METLPLSDLQETTGLRLIDSRPEAPAGDDLENAASVVVGGAGLGNMENFGLIRQLAAAIGGQSAATRPPVLNHWIAEDRLIGQTGKTVRPRLLISVGTSKVLTATAKDSRKTSSGLSGLTPSRGALT